MLYSRDQLNGTPYLTYGDFNTSGYGHGRMTLETTNLLHFAGISVNNSRQCSVEMRHSSADNKRADTYLRYMAVARAFITNAVVDS